MLLKEKKLNNNKISKTNSISFDEDYKKLVAMHLFLISTMILGTIIFIVTFFATCGVVKLITLCLGLTFRWDISIIIYFTVMLIYCFVG